MENCPIFKKCGGCQYLNMDYDDTIRIKRDYVLSCFKENNIKAKIDNIIKANNPYRYRNKMILGFKRIKGSIVCGFYEEGSHKIIDLDDCLMHSKEQIALAKYIKELIKRYKISIYDEDKGIGLLRYILIRESIRFGDILLTFVVSSDIFPSRSEIVKNIRLAFPNVKTIVQNINPRHTSIVLGDKERILYGDGYISDTILGLKFNTTSKSFYQVNPIQVEKLYKVVLDNLDENKDNILLDAYSGVGTIGLLASSKVDRVISVENNKQAHLASIQNARQNNIKNVSFVLDDATEYIDSLAINKEHVDCVILDPPRTGTTKEFISAIFKLKPKQVIYVSCDPLTLSRDLKELTKSYNINSVTLVDMFCFTKHIESIATLSLK